jgi:hypothetical protein
MSYLEEISATYFTYIFALFAIAVIFILAAIIAVQKLPGVPDLIKLGGFTDELNIKFDPLREGPYSFAFPLSQWKIADRTFFEHSIEAAYSGSLAGSGSSIVKDENIVSEFFVSTLVYSEEVIYGAFLKKGNSVIYDLIGEKKIYSIQIPLLYKNEVNFIEVKVT